MAEFRLYEEFSSIVNSASMYFVTEVSSRMIAEMMPFLIVMMTLSIMVMGIAGALGLGSISISSFMTWTFRALMVTSILGIGGFYQTDIAIAIQELPDDVATALFEKSGVTAANVIDNAASIGFTKGGEAFEAGGWFKDNWAAFWTFGVLLWLYTIVIIGVGAGFITVSTLVLAILAGIGPLFVAAMMFKSVQNFFTSWLSVLLSYGILVILVSALFGLGLYTFAHYVAQISFDEEMNLAYAIGGCGVLTFVYVMILWMLPGIARGLSHGITLEFLSSVAAAKGVTTGPAARLASNVVPFRPPAGRARGSRRAA